jgi:hypothetical protein
MIIVGRKRTATLGKACSEGRFVYDRPTAVRHPAKDPFFVFA